MELEYNITVLILVESLCSVVVGKDSVLRVPVVVYVYDCPFSHALYFLKCFGCDHQCFQPGLYTGFDKGFNHIFSILFQHKFLSVLSE